MEYAIARPLLCALFCYRFNAFDEDNVRGCLFGNWEPTPKILISTVTIFTTPLNLGTLEQDTRQLFFSQTHEFLCGPPVGSTICSGTGLHHGPPPPLQGNKNCRVSSGGDSHSTFCRHQIFESRVSEFWGISSISQSIHHYAKLTYSRHC